MIDGVPFPFVAIPPDPQPAVVAPPQAITAPAAALPAPALNDGLLAPLGGSAPGLAAVLGSGVTDPGLLFAPAAAAPVLPVPAVEPADRVTSGTRVDAIAYPRQGADAATIAAVLAAAAAIAVVIRRSVRRSGRERRPSA